MGKRRSKLRAITASDGDTIRVFALTSVLQGRKAGRLTISPGEFVNELPQVFDILTHISRRD